MPADPETIALIEANSFRPDALEANRSGVLTTEQARLLRRRRSARGVAMIVIGVGCVVSGGRGILPGETPEGGRFGPVTVLIIGAVILALRFSDFGRSYAGEIAAGRVFKAEGFVRVRHSLGGGESSQHASHYQIEGKEFETTEEGARLINPQARYRIYYLPNSDIMVNIERIG
jgi:hypothetical protein